jgi:hypothetical protein
MPTISFKHMRRLRGPRPWGQSWSTFLEDHFHQTWACDFLQLYDIWFRLIFAFFVIELGSRKVVHVAVTRNPHYDVGRPAAPKRDALRRRTSFHHRRQR